MFDRRTLSLVQGFCFKNSCDDVNPLSLNEESFYIETNKRLFDVLVNASYRLFSRFCNACFRIRSVCSAASLDDCLYGATSAVCLTSFCLRKSANFWQIHSIPLSERTSSGKLKSHLVIEQLWISCLPHICAIQLE